jgi:hypothetical protein
MLQALTFLWHGPHWLSYFNELAGGPKHGGEWVLDSNIDWGQDYFYLRDWQAEQPSRIKPQLLWFGLCDPQAFGVDYRTPENDWRPGDGIEKLLSTPGPTIISVNGVYGHRLHVQNSVTRLTPDESEALQKIAPSTWIGYAIRVYETKPNK